jgi:hypothetical protein
MSFVVAIADFMDNCSAGQRRLNVTALNNLPERSLWYVRRNVAWAAVRFFWSACCLALGCFLLSEIAGMPGLAMQFTLMGALSIVAAILVSLSAARDLLTRVAVSKDHIKLLPWPGGFRVSWHDLADWDMPPENELFSDFQPLLLWVRGRKEPHVINVAWLSVKDRHWLRQTLSTVARYA